MQNVFLNIRFFTKFYEKLYTLRRKHQFSASFCMFFFALNGAHFEGFLFYFSWFDIRGWSFLKTSSRGHPGINSICDHVCAM